MAGTLVFARQTFQLQASYRKPLAGTGVFLG